METSLALSFTSNTKLPLSLFGLKLTTCGWLSEPGVRKILLTGGQDLIGGLGGRGVLSGVFLRWLNDALAENKGIGLGVCNVAAFILSSVYAPLQTTLPLQWTTLKVTIPH